MFLNEYGENFSYEDVIRFLQQFYPTSFKHRYTLLHHFRLHEQ